MTAQMQDTGRRGNPLERRADGVGNELSDGPLVTVIALCFNHDRYVLDALNSIANQDFAPFELIIVDDGSSDDSVSLIKDWVTSYKGAAILDIHPQNLGLVGSLNAALALSHGRFIATIATDDIWLPHRLSSHVGVFDALSETYAVVYGDAELIDGRGEALGRRFIANCRKGSPPSGKILTALLSGNFIPGMAATIRRSAIEQVGGWDPDIGFEDYDMWLRLASKFSMKYVDEVVARYRVLQNSLSHAESSRCMMLDGTLRAIAKSTKDLTRSDRRIAGRSARYVAIRMCRQSCPASTDGLAVARSVDDSVVLRVLERSHRVRTSSWALLSISAFERGRLALHRLMSRQSRPYEDSRLR